MDPFRIASSNHSWWIKYQSIVEANSDRPLSHLFFSLSSCGGRAGRTYMSSTSSLLTLEMLGRASVLEERSSDITAEENCFTGYNGLSENKETLSFFFFFRSLFLHSFWTGLLPPR